MWLRVEPLFAAAIDMDAAARAECLAGLDAADPPAAAVLRRMLETHERAVRRQEMETVPKLAPWPLAGSPHAPGERIGPFELERALGRGGMGEVWLARQADGRVERRVALKLAAVHAYGEGLAERFGRERDILARLEHPNIARLYDAGVTEAGQPWLAMEYVEGMSLSEYVETRTVSLAARLALYRQVLAAVAHAHRHLIVHRDLKPANILIDGAGQVRLLDFGIARMIDDDEAGSSSALTRAGGRMMTLRYAAPEQAAGGAITTATDIYSLGVILHELVTGLAPYRAVREGKPLTEAMLLREETTVPSKLALSAATARSFGLASARQLARLVSGELDAIVLKAMRRDPADRYASVHLLDQDILAFLEKRPVKARAGTWRYLAGRFALRQKVPIALLSTVLAMLVLGLVMADRERRVAVAQKARAEKHFASVRTLANTLIFDVHAKLERVPGSLEARALLVKTALDYLDALLAEAGGDPALMAEIAVAYGRIGNIQGQPGAANLGEVSEAIGKFEKGKALFSAVATMRPDDMRIVREHRNLSFALARAYALKGDPRWRPEIAAMVALSQRVAGLPGATPGDRAMVAKGIAEQAHLLAAFTGQDAATEAAVLEAVRSVETLVAEYPRDPVVREALMAVYRSAGDVLTGNRWTPASARQGVDFYGKALTTVRGAIALDPGDAQMRELEVDNMVRLAQTTARTGEYREADAVMGEAVKRAAALVALDPRNVNLAGVYLVVQANAALMANRVGDPARAVRHGREAIAIAAGLSPDARATRYVHGYVAFAKVHVGAALLAMAANGAPRERLSMLLEARGLLADGVAYLEEIRAHHLGPLSEADVRELMDYVARCDAALAQLRAG